MKTERTLLSEKIELELRLKEIKQEIIALYNDIKLGDKITLVGGRRAIVLSELETETNTYYCAIMLKDNQVGFELTQTSSITSRGWEEKEFATKDMGK